MKDRIEQIKEDEFNVNPDTYRGTEYVSGTNGVQCYHSEITPGLTLAQRKEKEIATILKRGDVLVTVGDWIPADPQKAITDYQRVCLHNSLKEDNPK